MIQQVLKRIIETDSTLEIIGFAEDGIEAVEMCCKYNPDLVLLDIRMPHMDGVEATKEIIKKHPTPILIVTATMTLHMQQLFECLNMGAIDVIKTPTQEKSTELLHKIHITARIGKKMKQSQKPLTPVVRPKNNEQVAVPIKTDNLQSQKSARKILAIGASTGGPKAVYNLLSQLPKDLNAAIMIIQHIDSEFAMGLVEWWQTGTSLRILPGITGHDFINGEAMVCVKNQNLIVTATKKVLYVNPPAGTIHVPNIDASLTSVANHFGKNAIGVLLTGMGHDGAQGLNKIKQAGGKTIAQDEASSIIYGMPKAAVELGAAEVVTGIDRMGKTILELLDYN